MKKDIVELTKKLIKIQSTSDKPDNLKKVLQIAKEHLVSDKVIVKEFTYNRKPSLVATMVETKTPEIILNGHLDVVSANLDQFIPRIEGNKLIGRGTQDMKASCASMIYVFKKLAEDKDFPRNTLGLMLVTDEEIGGFSGTKKLLEEGFTPKFFLAGESTDFGLEIAAKGVFKLEIEIFGRPAHSAYLWEGKNAIHESTKVISQIYKMFPTPTENVWETTVNLAIIEGGEVSNKVPSTCKFLLDIRYVPEDNPDEIKDAIKNMLPENSTIKVVEREPTVNTNPKNIYIHQLEKIIKQEIGKNPEYKKTCGASDARFYSGAGIAVTNFGPIGGGLHSDNEWVDIDSLGMQASILEKWLRL